MTDKIKEARRAKFEDWFLSEGDDESYVWRDESGHYRHRVTEIAWGAYNSALDSVEIELPEGFAYMDSQSECDRFYWSESVHKAIESQGYKVKPD